MATALYFIDKLALRAGHEKDDDEADTVGCCTLKARTQPRNRQRLPATAAAALSSSLLRLPATAAAAAAVSSSLLRQPAAAARRRPPAPQWPPSTCTAQRHSPQPTCRRRASNTPPAACSVPLQMENVECIPPNMIKFDFLGEHSMAQHSVAQQNGAA
jgi:hypothetical protein